MAEAAAASLGNLLGKYTPANHTVHLNREVLRHAAQREGADGDEALRMLKVVLAHELAHAMQQEAHPVLDAYGSAPHKDAMDAQRATDEGQATWLQERVAASQGWQTAHRRATRLQGWEPDGALSDPRGFSVFAIYGQGRNFIDHLVKQHGQDYVWTTVLSHPPATTAMIFRPHTYVPEPVAHEGLDLESALADVLPVLTRGEWQHISSPIGELALRTEAIRTDYEALQDILAHLHQAQTIRGWRPDRSAEVRALVFDTPQAAQRYLDLLRRENLTETRDAAAATGVPITITWSPFVFDALDYDKGIERIEQIPLAGGAFQEERAVWVARGALVVVVQTAGFRPGLRTGRAVAHVLNALENP